MTPRQARILDAIVEHYVKTASPVGSLALADMFDVSSATIRAEMAELEQLGMITHPHTSAGRVPTDQGYREYVDNLQTEQEQISEEDRKHRAIGQRIEAAGEPTQAIRSAVESLVEATDNAGLAMAGNLYVSGLSHLFSQPEFTKAQRIHAVARLLDSLEPWLRESAPENRLNIYIGEEAPVGKASGCSLIISRFVSPFSDYSYIGVVGPTRQSYSDVIDTVRYVSERLEENLHG